MYTYTSIIRDIFKEYIIETKMNIIGISMSIQFIY